MGVQFWGFIHFHRVFFVEDRYGVKCDKVLTSTGTVLSSFAITEIATKNHYHVHIGRKMFIDS